MTPQERVARVIAAIETTPEAVIAREQAIEALAGSATDERAAELGVALARGATAILARHPDLRRELDEEQLLAVLAGQVGSATLDGQMTTVIPLQSTDSGVS